MSGQNVPGQNVPACLYRQAGTFCHGDILSLGTFCPGTFCHGDVLSWGRFVLGTFCPWGHFVQGRFVFGDVLSFGIFYMGIFCPGGHFVMLSNSTLKKIPVWPGELARSYNNACSIGPSQLFRPHCTYLYRHKSECYCSQQISNVN